MSLQYFTPEIFPLLYLYSIYYVVNYQQPDNDFGKSKQFDEYKSTLTYFNTPSSVFHIMMYAFLELNAFLNLAVNTAYIYIM